jgi:hypothetical protein
MIEMLFQDDSDYLFHQFHLHLVHTSLFVVVENDHAATATSLTDDLNVISNWAKQWAIQFNPQQTKNIVFSRRDREHPPVYFGLNGDEIDETDNHCHLPALIHLRVEEKPSETSFVVDLRGNFQSMILIVC